MSGNIQLHCNVMAYSRMRRRFPRARVWPPVAPNSSLHIARAQVVEAHDRAARARLPSREIQEHLLELYFSHVHPFLPILHKETFLADFRKM